MVLGIFEVAVLTKRLGVLDERRLFVSEVSSDDPKRFNLEGNTSAFIGLWRNKVRVKAFMKASRMSTENVINHANAQLASEQPPLGRRIELNLNGRATYPWTSHYSTGEKIKDKVSSGFFRVIIKSYEVESMKMICYIWQGRKSESILVSCQM